MHANTNSIKFDFEEAEKFHAALRNCKTTLENQARDRNEVTEYAKSQLEGGYGRLSSLVMLTVSLRWEQSSSSLFGTPKII